MELSRARYNDRLATILFEEGAATREELDRVSHLAAARRTDLAEALVEAEVVSVDVVLAALSKVYDVPCVDPKVMGGDPLILSLLPKEEAIRLEALPFFLVENRLVVAVSDPEDFAKLNELEFVTGKLIQPALALGSQIREVLQEAYGPDGLETLEELKFESVGGDVDGQRSTELEVMNDERPIVRLVNLILVRAVHERASDVHLEPTRERLVVRFRIDGGLRRRAYQIPASVSPAVISRIKVLARLDIAVQRRPQDGNMRFLYRGRRIDLRVSIFPSIHGEKAVVRVLDQTRTQFSLKNVGMGKELQERWQELLKRREGILVVSGPTGSGKTSTLFASARELASPEINVVTLEDPVEYEIEGVTQGHVNEKTGLTFASGLRSILRQDPDVILVGEIRDSETAQVAVRAALTGHLVLASMHTNDAPAAVFRLLDLDVPPYLISSALIGVLAQRLVRKVCDQCHQQVELGEGENSTLRPWLARIGPTIREAKGCKRCGGMGYRGRTGVFELMTVTPEIRGLIAEQASLQTLRDAAVVESYRPMWLDGLDKVDAGVTTARELYRKVEMVPPQDSGSMQKVVSWNVGSREKVARLAKGCSSRKGLRSITGS